MNTFDSTDDKRTENNPAGNETRKVYRELTETEKADMVALKNMGQAFIDRCNAIGKSRELSLAVTNAEQAVMWAVKHVTA